MKAHMIGIVRSENSSFSGDESVPASATGPFIAGMVIGIVGTIFASTLSINARTGIRAIDQYNKKYSPDLMD